jgi:hypothetical protein
MLGKLRLRLGERLQLLERHAWYHLDHEQSLRRHIDHREVAVNAPHPVTNTVDPSRTPATASAVVLTCLSITAKAPRVPYGQLDHRAVPRKAQICSHDPHRLLHGGPGVRRDDRTMTTSQ